MSFFLGAHPGYYFGSLVIINRQRLICIIILAIFSHVILHFVAPIWMYQKYSLSNQSDRPLKRRSTLQVEFLFIYNIKYILYMCIYINDGTTNSNLQFVSNLGSSKFDLFM